MSTCLRARLVAIGDELDDILATGGQDPGLTTWPPWVTEAIE